MVDTEHLDGLLASGDEVDLLGRYADWPRLDAEGHTVVPGLIDAHALAGLGVTVTQTEVLFVDFEDSEDGRAFKVKLDEYLESIRDIELRIERAAKDVLRLWEGGVVRPIDPDRPAVTLERPGEYRVQLVVTDPEGASDTASVALLAGNEPPSVTLSLTRGNRSFFFEGDTVARCGPTWPSREADPVRRTR